MRNKKIKGIVSDTETLLLFQVTENWKCTMKKEKKEDKNNNMMKKIFI